MKQFLLAGMMSAIGFGLTATSPAGVLATAADAPIRVSHAKALPAGKQHRQLRTVNIPTDRQNRINPQSVRRSAGPEKTALPDGVSFYEGFEGWDGQDVTWLPDGWTMESKGDASLTDMEKWGMSTSVYDIMPADGKYMVAIDYASVAQDEWLITPQITVSENEVLTFYDYYSPLYLFNIDNVDWDNMTFIGDKVVASTLQVWVRPTGGEWAMLLDVADKYKDMSLEDLLMAESYSLGKETITLADYVGKDVQIGFRCVGKDGNTMLIDAVTVGMPVLEGVRYSNPLETLYWGFDRTPGWGYFPYMVAQYPVYTPITWKNATDDTSLTYSWKYSDPETGEYVDSDSQEALSVTYVPDYTTELTTTNNLFNPPVLSASAPGAASASYTAPYDKFQVGGKPQWEFDDKSMFEPGLIPFNITDEEFGIVTVEADFGEQSTPIFGYNKNTDQYWLDYTFRYDEPGANDKIFLSAIMNYITPAASPLVVTGASILAYGIVSDAAEFKLEIIPLNDDSTFDEANVIATAVCKGTDLIRAEFGMNEMLTVPFDFETPVVLDNSRKAYMVKFSGFHSDAVEYFAPVQSLKPNLDYQLIGWLVKEFFIDGESRTSVSPIANIEGEYGPCYNAFAINLEGFYPWLKAADTEVEIADAPATVSLDSYYDGTELTVEAPAEIEATVEGRYGDCTLTLNRASDQALDNATVTIKAPGVETAVKVSMTVNGIDEVTATAGNTVTGIYTLTGQRIGAEAARNGVYIVTYADGSARKVVLD